MCIIYYINSLGEGKDSIPYTICGEGIVFDLEKDVSIKVLEIGYHPTWNGNQLQIVHD